MARVELEGVGKSYGGGRLAVRDVTLDVADGEFSVLVGPSGCGKSTTLRMVAGLEEASTGRIRIGGRDVTALAPKDRDVAMVFQNYALYPHMTVYDNLAFGLRNRRTPEKRIRDEIDRAAGILGIADLLDRKPRQLSGGQQQRVALGRCIVRHPAVFLFDEPLSNLDANLRAQMRLELKRLRERVPTTAIYVTHDQVEAMTLADRVVVMRDGAIEQVGRPLDVYGAPDTMFVAGFLGAPAMNFVDVELREEGGLLWLTAPGLKLTAPPERTAALRAHGSRRVVLGVRPENLALGDVVGQSFDGRVEVVEPLGAETVLQVAAAGTTVTVSRVPPDIPIRPGAAVGLAVEPDRLHLFDAGTGRAIR